MRYPLDVRDGFLREYMPQEFLVRHLSRVLLASRHGRLLMAQPMNLVKLIEQYGDESKARECLERLRWPEGVHCPRCGFDKISRLRSKTYYRSGPRKGEVRGTREQFDCDSCRYQFSVTSGTLFHDTHLPLWKWFLATYLMCESRKGISSNQLKRTLGVTYKTAWYLTHRIRSAMIEADPTMLTGIVEADETYIGGKQRRVHPDRQEAAKRRLDNKTVVLGAIQRGGKLRVQMAPNNKGRTIRGFIRDTVDDHAEAIYSDSANVYKRVASYYTRHESVDHSAYEWVRGDVHTNTIESAWSLFDRAVIGSYHQLSRKHMPAYLQEFEFRFNNRENPFLFRDTLLRLIDGHTLTYADLVAPEDAEANRG
jgi:transposase-like protein